MATIAPPIAGIRVYFRVFDVDDPFDQIHGPDGASVIANVNLIDNGQIGGDNRGTSTGLGDSSALTDANGEARITITVSMQPGDNYRAAASVISEAVQTQIDQTDADALSATQVTNTDGTQYWKANGGFIPGCKTDWAALNGVAWTSVAAKVLRIRERCLERRLPVLLLGCAGTGKRRRQRPLGIR